MAKGSAAIAIAIWNQNSASVNSSVALGQYFRIRDFSIAETILWFMVKCLLLLWIVYMSGLEMITVIKKLWGKATFLKSQVLWPHCICWRSLQEEGVPYWCSILLTSKEWQIKTPLEIPFLCIRMPESSDVGKGDTPTWWHWSVNCYTLNGNNLATSTKIKISPALWHSYSTSKNLSYKINIFRVALNDIWRKMLIATLFIVVKHVHQGELVKIMIFIHVTGYRSRCTSPKEKKKPPKQNILPNRIPNIIQFL